jgi:kynurenine formamidase
MIVDITLQLTPELMSTAWENTAKHPIGHIVTHFDVMNKEFPLEYTRRKAVVFDVSAVKDRDIDIADIELSKVEKDMFVAFYTGFIEKTGYGGKVYFKEHPQLSNELIDALLAKEISLIGVDFAGVRRGKEHTPMDQYCADHGVFIIENLCNLKNAIGECIINTYPVNYAGMTGLPCRVVAEV